MTTSPDVVLSQTLQELYGFKTMKKTSYDIGDLIDMKDDWGPGMIFDYILDRKEEEWKYHVSFPLVKQERWFYEKKIKYWIKMKMIKVIKTSKKEKD